jgi:hypothetical protein
MLQAARALLVVPALYTHLSVSPIDCHVLPGLFSVKRVAADMQQGSDRIAVTNDFSAATVAVSTYCRWQQQQKGQQESQACLRPRHAKSLGSGRKRRNGNPALDDVRDFRCQLKAQNAVT